MLPQLLPELISIWRQSRQRQCFVRFLDFEPLLDLSLLEMRPEFELLPFFDSVVLKQNRMKWLEARKY